jgi:hypothetical protein
VPSINDFLFLFFGFSPTERSANSDTHTYPDGFFGHRKHGGPDCRAYADPVARSIKIFLLFVHFYRRSQLFNRNAFSKIARLIDVSAPRYGHMVRQ